MGLESFVSQVQFPTFLGLNEKYSDLSLDIREAADLNNVFIDEKRLFKRFGSTIKNTGNQIDDGANPTAILGFKEFQISGTTYRVAVAYNKIYTINWSTGAPTDVTGAVTITNGDNNMWSFETFLDGSGNEIVIGWNGVDDAIKWTGSSNFAAFTGPTSYADFTHAVRHKNIFWVAKDDFIFYSDVLDGESWDTANRVIRLQNGGQDISGMVVYADSIIVFQNKAIWRISGSTDRDLFIEKVVTDDGTDCPGSIKVIQSRRFGSVIMYLSSNDGRLKMFNGSKSPIPVGDLIPLTMSNMSQANRIYARAANYQERNWYVIFMQSAASSSKDTCIIYDYYNDTFSDDTRVLSSFLKFTGDGMENNICDVATGTDGEQVLVTGTYDGYLLIQDTGNLDRDTQIVNCSWKSRKIDFGSMDVVKMINDLNMVVESSNITDVTITVQSDAGIFYSTKEFEGEGGTWDDFDWGSDTDTISSTDLVWATDADLIYKRMELNSDGDDMIPYGRSFQFSVSNNADQDMSIETIIIGVTPLGSQSQYLES